MKGEGAMLMFCGFDLQLVVEVVVNRSDGLKVCGGRDFTNRQWLVVQVDDDPARLAWLCAPVSDRALQAVVSGRTPPMDAVRHSQTGTVELVTVDHGRAVPEQCLLCSGIPEDLLHPSDWGLAAAA
jgi:hypothetical protein